MIKITCTGKKKSKRISFKGYFMLSKQQSKHHYDIIYPNFKWKKYNNIN